MIMRHNHKIHIGSLCKSVFAFPLTWMNQKITSVTKICKTALFFAKKPETATDNNTEKPT